MWKSIVTEVVATATGGTVRTTTAHVLVTATTCQAGGHTMKVTPETLCNKCGRCCYFKARNLEGELIFTNYPCRHLDLKTKLCKVYVIRHKVAPWCVDPLRNLEGDPCLPTDCPLAQVYGPPGYVGPKENP